ncbi:MAG: hypothetical protein H8E44_44025 [Planctomycetes bacterium]|nr:hypothetical protein [Planctomycetota bacterium]MBL7041615.1 hypothetical protein [Pirellulaceae bacterium]
MAGQLIPTPDDAPAVPRDLTPEQCVKMWSDLMETCDQFLIAGLRAEIGPDGDLAEAYRQWYAQTMQEHDRMIFRMATTFNERMARDVT